MPERKPQYRPLQAARDAEENARVDELARQGHLRNFTLWVNPSPPQPDPEPSPPAPTLLPHSSGMSFPSTWTEEEKAA